MKQYVELIMNVTSFIAQDVVTMSQTNNSSLNENDDTIEDFFN